MKNRKEPDMATIHDINIAPALATSVARFLDEVSTKGA
jgi:hypothetical protein